MLDGDGDGDVHATEVKTFVRLNLVEMQRHLRTAGGRKGISLAKMQILKTQVQKDAFKLFSKLSQQASFFTAAELLHVSQESNASGVNPFEKLLLDAFERGLEYANSPNHDGENAEL